MSWCLRLNRLENVSCCLARSITLDFGFLSISTLRIPSLAPSTLRAQIRPVRKSPTGLSTVLIFAITSRQCSKSNSSRSINCLLTLEPLVGNTEPLIGTSVSRQLIDLDELDLEHCRDV